MAEVIVCYDVQLNLKQVADYNLKSIFIWLHIQKRSWYVFIQNHVQVGFKVLQKRTRAFKEQMKHQMDKNREKGSYHNGHNESLGQKIEF